MFKEKCSNNKTANVVKMFKEKCSNNKTANVVTI